MEESRLKRYEYLTMYKHKKEGSLPPLISDAALSKLKVEDILNLVDPILPGIGLAMLVGPTDTGKSQLARQLAIQVANASTSFLGYKMNVRTPRVIYVATEDDHANTKRVSARQHRGLQLQQSANLEYLFTYDYDPQEVLFILEENLKASPASLVVIDSFGDVFLGKDLNSNAEVRATMKPYFALAMKYKCLILFVHHVNQKKNSGRPNQRDVQGASSSVQKVRSILHLVRDSMNRKLYITKGNYVADAVKRKAQILHFDSFTFIYTHAGEADIGSSEQTVAPQLPRKKQLKEQFARQVLATLQVQYADAAMTNEEIRKVVEQLLSKAAEPAIGMSKPTIYKFIAEMVTDQLLFQDDKQYFIKSQAN